MSSTPLSELLFVDGATAKGEILARCRRQMADLPGGRPRTISDLLAILVLASDGEEVAQIQLLRQKLDYLTFTNPGKVGLFLAKAIEEGEPRLLEALHQERRRREIPENAIAEAKKRLEELWEDVRDRWDKIREKAEDLQRQISLPPGLTIKTYQAEAIVFADEVAQGRVLIGDDRGLGKTVEALCILRRWQQLGRKTFPALIVTPKSMRGTWKREIQKWIPEAKVKYLGEEGDAAIVIAMIHEIRDEVSELKQKFFSVLVDESQMLVGLESKRFLALLQIRSGSPLRIALSGTPMPNGRPIELWPTLQFLTPQGLPKLPEYRWKFCDPTKMFRGKKKPITTFKGLSNAVAFARLTKNIIIERKKGETGLPLPAKTQYALAIDLTPEEQRQIQDHKQQIHDRIEAEACRLEEEMIARGEKEEDISEKVTQHRRSEAMIAYTAMRILTGKLKIPYIVDRVVDLVARGDRPLVFIDHDEVAQMLVPLLKEALGPAQVRICTGKTSSKKREEAIAWWEAGKGQALVLSRAISIGVTLISGRWVLFGERYSVPADEDQAADRVHRMNQTQDCGIEFTHAYGTTDDVLDPRNEEKKEASARVRGAIEDRVLNWLKPKTLRMAS